MEKLAQWLAERFQHPLSLLFFILGALLILIGVTTGLEVPLLKQLAPDVDFRWVSLAIGLVFALLSVLIYYRPPKSTKVSHTVPLSSAVSDEAMSKFSVRKSLLSDSQGHILSFFEKESLDRSFNSYIDQTTLEGRFAQYGKAELFYRLEYLRLIGFLEGQALGKDIYGIDRFLYRLSSAYAEELGVPNTPHRQRIQSAPL